MSGYLGSYAELGVMFVVAGVVFVAAFFLNWLLRPRRAVRVEEKYVSYECGLDPVGGDWAHTNVRYYLYAFLYTLFAVESVFLFPWALTFLDVGEAAFWSMVIFIVTLGLGLVYAWKRGVHTWR